MIKVLINNEEVVSNHNLEIKEEMLSTSSTILKNCYPKVWENDKDYVSRFYYPKDYSKCKIYNLPRENTTQEQTGTNLSFKTYVGKSTIEDIKFYGNTLQNGTPTPDTPVEIQSVTGLQNINVCGKNLFNSSVITNSKITISEDGTLNVSDVGGANGYCETGKTLSQLCPDLKVGDIVYLYIDTDFYYNGSKRDLIYCRGNWTNGTSKTITQDMLNGIVVIYGGYQTTSHIKIMITKQLETEYEPYKGNTYEVNLGKNLFDKNLLPSTWSSQVVNMITLNVEPNTKYTMSSNIPYGGTVADLFLYDESGTGSTATNGVKDGKNVTVTSSSTGIIKVGYRSNLGTTVTRDDYWYQIEKGSTATSYSPYFTPIELNKIGTYQDRIYKDNGKWYVEKNTRRLELAIADMNNNENYPGWKNTNEIQQLKTDVFNGVVTANLNSYSNFYSNITGYNSYGIGVNFNNQATLYLKKSNFNLTQTQWKTNYPNLVFSIIYGIQTPEITEITNEELINQLESLNIQLYEGQTNFIINGSLPMPTYIKIYTNFEELIFCGFTKNTGNVSLNPREFHGVDLQILDFKDLLSTGETLNYVIANKTITEAINQVVNSISDYGFVVGNIQLLNPNEMIGAYSTLNKTAYDVFQYFAEITQSRWTTRLIDENTIAIDFYDPSLMPTGVDIDKTQTFYENYKIIDMSFNYSTNDYRNKQIMTSDEVYANITQTETIIADGYATSFMCQNKIGIITSIKLNGVEKSYATKSEEQLGITADFVYQPGETTFTSNNSIGAGGVIVITYYPIVKGREIVLNNTESDRIESQINRNGTISRYENRNDTTSSQELQKIGQSYIKYKGNAEINLKIVSELNTWNVGEIVSYNAPINELSTTYMVKSKQISMYLNANKIIYTYNLTSNYNCENAVNYFDNQRAKSQGNIGEGETISRNIDIENKALIIFYDTEQEKIEPINPSSLDFALDGVLI